LSPPAFVQQTGSFAAAGDRFWGAMGRPNGLNTGRPRGRLL